MARLALSLSRERSISANAALAGATLARGLPAEAEALAQAAFSDVQMLLPLARREHYVACLATLCRAQRELNRSAAASHAFEVLRKAPRHIQPLQALALVEEAERLATNNGASDRRPGSTPRSAVRSGECRCAECFFPITRRCRADRRPRPYLCDGLVWQRYRPLGFRSRSAE